MAKTGVDNSGEITPNPKKSTAEDILAKWYVELKDDMLFTHNAEYSQQGLDTIFKNVQFVRGKLSRLDTILASARRMEQKLKINFEAAQAAYDDALDLLRKKPEHLIGKGFAATEREAWCRSDPVLLNERIKLRRLMGTLGEVQTFIKVADTRYRNLDGSRNDLLLLTSLIRLGWNLREST